MDFKRLLIEYAASMDLYIDFEAAERLEEYKALLIEWNEKMNLTAITDEKEIIIKHFLDSISVLKYMELSSFSKSVDIGTGAGFPGIPLKILRPDAEFTLLDSLNKRVNFLNTVIDKLSLKNIEAVHLRAEEGASKKEYRESFDYCFSRAVASLSVLSEYCLPYVKKGGSFVSYKGPDTKEEIASSQNALKILGGKIKKEEKVQLPQSDIIHSLIFIEKISHTPAKYPRKPGVIKEKPII